MKLFGKTDLRNKQFSRMINTGIVDRTIQEMIERHPSPIIGRGGIKFLYATQPRTRPPKFVVFVN